MNNGGGVCVCVCVISADYFFFCNLKIALREKEMSEILWKDLQKINSVKKGMASSQQQFEVDICNKTEKKKKGKKN